MSAFNPSKPQDPNVAFFIQESLRIARQMPIPDCRAYLSGMLALIGDCDESDVIRHAVIHLDESDRQLQLLAKPQ